ncbi:alpha amylase C-terminal domain-containing protein [Candidatus Pacearchaeota archaeon]|nr:alpha amylase C-terminal domain-containing protein [Candidatus Pacearchaeota archaeon]
MQLDNYKYQWEINSENTEPKNNLKDWVSNYGANVIDRDEDGFASKIKFNVLIDNADLDVFVVGDFNNWESDILKLKTYKLKKDQHSVIGNVDLDDVKHKDEYKLLVHNNKTKSQFMIQDPAGALFSDSGNNIFWDYNDPSAYSPKFDFVNTFERSVKIMQTDLPGLVAHFANKNNICGKDIDNKNLYRFIAESGVIEEIKNLGFNTVQFLPFAQSIDGDNWKFRYLVPFQFAVQKNWGTPDDFAYMIDMFHKNKIAVVGDFVLGHLPSKDFSIFGQSSADHGLHQWKKQNSSNGHERRLYMKEETSWGTMRVDFDNAYVRDFFISSCIHFMKYYHVDGFRVDNVDGIIRYGDSGQGEDRPNGRKFLRELNQAIYSFNPAALINYEAHFFYDDNAKMLIAPINSDSRALGGTAYNSSRMTHYFHTKYMFNASENISVWKFRNIVEEKVWGKSNSTIADFHNHDAAAGLMENRCTGAYAYNCMMEGGESNHIHGVGKIKVMEALISLAGEGRTLDLLQTFLLQPGTFEHNSSIEWFQSFNEISRALVDYKKDINLLMDDSAFWPKNVKHRNFLSVDDKNKVLVIERKGDDSKYIIVINTSSWKHYDYSVGIKDGEEYITVFNSDKLKYAGFGLASYPDKLKVNSSNNFELLDKEIVLPILPPYGVIVFKKVNQY